MSDPITLPAPALAPAQTPAAAPIAAADSAGRASFSSTLSALNATPAPVSAALPRPDPTPDPSLDPSPDPAAALALALPTLALAGTRLPLTGKSLPLDPAGPADKAPAKTHSQGDAAHATPAPASDDPAASPLAVMLPLPVPVPVPTPATPTTGEPIQAALVANPPKALPRLPADAPPPAEPEAPRGNPARQATAAAQVPLAGVQLRASFGAGSTAGDTGGHDAAGDGRPAAATTDEATLAPLTAIPAPTLHLAALATPGAAPAAAATPTAVPAGQDLAALVDRLVEARGAAQAGAAVGPVSTTLTHADFGRVSVHFAPDAKGLSVTLSSTDPAFAGTAQAALSVSSASAGDGTQLFDGRGAGAGDSARNTGASGFSGNAMSGNSSGGSGNPGPRPDARFAPAQSVNPAPPRAAATATPGSIFA
jgi:hypothetical protein